MAKVKLPSKRMTKDAIASWLGVSIRSVENYIERLQLKPDSTGKYASLSCYKEHEQRKRNDPKNTDHGDGVPPIRTWSDVEKRERVNKLQIEIQSLRDELMSMDEVRDNMSKLSQAVVAGLNNWVERIASEKRDPEALAWAEDARRVALAYIKSEIDAL